MMKVLTIPYFPFRHYEPIDALTEFQTVGLASWRDWWAKYFDIFGGRARVYERPTMNAIQDATSRMKQEAKNLGADAIIGYSISVFPLNSKGMGMSQVLVCGTAVRFVSMPASKVTSRTTRPAEEPTEPTIAEHSVPVGVFPGFSDLDIQVPSLDGVSRSSSIVK
jgi:uncharacterized protein YbjQ (UPF0145 family)